MIALLWCLLTLFASPLKSKSRLEAENAALRYQLIVLRRKVGGRVRLTNGDRLFFIQLYRCLNAGAIIPHCSDRVIRLRRSKNPAADSLFAFDSAEGEG